MKPSVLRNIQDLLEQTSDNPSPYEREKQQQLLADLRRELRAGVEAHLQELPSFIRLADRFGSYADVWNASMILERQSGLTSDLRALQISAWLMLFPSEARRKPEVVLEILQQSEDELDDRARSGILTRWLDNTLNIAQKTRFFRNANSTLVASLKLANSWWAPEEWISKAPGFAASFAELAMASARAEINNQSAPPAELYHAFAVSLLIRDSLGVWDDLQEEEGDNKRTSIEHATFTNVFPVDQIITTRRRIWVVGALRAKWEHLMGIVKQYGLNDDIFVHVDYSELRNRSLPARIDITKDIGVLLGPVPHSTKEVGEYSSLAVQLKRELGMVVIELRAHSAGQELKITKTSFRAGLMRLLGDPAVAAKLS